MRKSMTAEKKIGVDLSATMSMPLQYAFMSYLMIQPDIFISLSPYFSSTLKCLSV